MKRLLTLLLISFIAFQSKATTYTINVSNYVFTPNAITINLGDSLNFHRVAGTHPVASETGAWATFTMSGALLNKTIVLTTAGTYAYYCQFHGGVGGVGMSGTITVIDAPPPCNIPTGVSASLITATSAKISWTAVAGATKYQVQFRPAGVGASWTKANTTMTNKTLMGLTPSTTYQYKVKTICDLNSSSFSPVQTFTTLAGKGEMPEEMDDMEEHITHIGVFPNPSNGEFQLVLDHIHVSEVYVQIFDMSGKLIYEGTVKPIEDGVVENIKLPDGFSGNAIVKVDVGGNILTHDVLVQ